MGNQIAHDAACPGCGNCSLVQEPLPKGASSCATCNGWFLDRDAAYHFLVDEVALDGANIGQLLANPGPRQRRCASCSASMSDIAVRDHSVDLCGRCGSAFFDHGVMGPLSGGRFGRGGGAPRPVSGVDHRTGRAPAPQPLPPAPLNPFGDPDHSGPLPMPPGFQAPPPVTASAGASAPGHSSPAVSATTTPGRPADVRAPAVAAGVSIPELSLSGSGAASRSGAALRKPSIKPVTLALGAAALVLLVAGGTVAAIYGSGEGAKPDAADAEESRADRYARYLRHYPFGGRTVDMWAEQLARLQPNGPEDNPQLFALTKKRAQRVGLRVQQEGANYTVEIGPAMSERLLERLGVE